MGDFVLYCFLGVLVVVNVALVKKNGHSPAGAHSGGIGHSSQDDT